LRHHKKRGLDALSSFYSFRRHAALLLTASMLLSGPAVESARADAVSIRPVATAFRPPSGQALAYAQAALETLRTYSLHRDSANWPALRESLSAALGGASQVSDTYGAIARLARQVDPHSGFLTPAEYRSYTAERPSPETSPAAARAAVVEGRFGYLSLPSFLGTGRLRSTAYADALLLALLSQDSLGVCAWIVDLRSNGGGNCYPMLAGLGPLVGEGTLGYFVHAGGSRSAWQFSPGTFFVRNDGGDTTRATSTVSARMRRGVFPVAVLIGSGTASSGEVVATAFRGRRATRFFGQPTAGATTGNRLVRLADGAALNVTSSRFADRTGKTVDGPLVPEEPVAPGQWAGLTFDPVVQAAVYWLKTLRACEPNVKQTESPSRRGSQP